MANARNGEITCDREAMFLAAAAAAAAPPTSSYAAAARPAAVQSGTSRPTDNFLPWARYHEVWIEAEIDTIQSLLEEKSNRI